jgi:energy-converting hydrogenase B subunit D
MTIANGLYALVLTLLFMVFQAPDVALSMIVVGGIAYPVVLLAAIAKVRAKDDDEERPG